VLALQGSLLPCLQHDVPVAVRAEKTPAAAHVTPKLERLGALRTELAIAMVASYHLPAPLFAPRANAQVLDS